MIAKTVQEQIERCRDWPQRLPSEQWSIYKQVIAEATRRHIPFAVGGGLAAMAYAGQWRNSKDIDLYIHAQDRERMVELVHDLGLTDYYDTLPYDRAWIYRSVRGETIVDIIWAMANQRAQVDHVWLSGPEVEVDGEHFRLLPAEEALWSKLYVLQRDRCDWPDAFNLLYGAGPEMDWKRLLDRLADDRPLLRAVLTLFLWLSPDRSRELPTWIWPELDLDPPARDQPVLAGAHARLLDSRPWFTPAIPPEKGKAAGC